jgi:hypothetical protein
MHANSWLWIALIAFLVFCCLPMLFMGRDRSRPHDAGKEEDRNSDK